MPDKTKMTDREILLELCSQAENNNKNSKQQFFALIGVIMALIGGKLISTPWYVDVAVILSLVSGTFLLCTVIYWWKQYDKAQIATRLTGMTLLLVSAITQIWIYQPGIESAPGWFPLVINILMVLLAVSMMYAGWTIRPKNGKNHCNKEVLK